MSSILNDSFLLEGLKETPIVRLDGRRRFDLRQLDIQLGPLAGQVEVSIGGSSARCSVSGEVVAPQPERPNEGRLMFNVEFGPIASPNFESGRPSIEAVSLCNLVERVLRGSKAIDVEALCVLGGRKVWSIRVDVRALNDDGNLTDCCCLAALVALMHFRREEVDESGQVIAASEREPVPLSVHHLPLTLTFALFPAEAGKSLSIADPTAAEERASSGQLTVTMNQHGELCGIHKPGGVPVDVEALRECTELAVRRAKDLTAIIQGKLDEAKSARALRKRNIHQKYLGKSVVAVTFDINS